MCESAIFINFASHLSHNVPLYSAFMKLLLINPRFPESFWSFSWALNKVTRDKKAVNSPLGLATLAGLTPQDWEITIIDENVEAIDWDFDADLVGVCGMGVQFPRQKEILDHFRERGIHTVAGGSYASLCPEEYEGFADTVVSGEAEYIWPQFCADFNAGKSERLYKETGEVNLSDSLMPRYDLLDLDAYQKVSLQFSRGCPYRCEFCDIIVMFGRKPRTKSPEQIGRELDVLRESGVTSIFFVDDNLIGHIREAKNLLRYLVDYQKRHNYRFSFGTESSLNMASDKELMQLFREANFEWVFIGIETPSVEGLKETGKTQNLREDIQTSIQTIYSHGVDIFAGFIVGFDSDGKDIFDRQYDFILASGITVSMVGLLHALPKTPLYERLDKAQRLREVQTSDNTRPATNIIPIKMSYDELITGYQGLLKRLLKDKAIYRRIVNKVRYMRDPLTSPHMSGRQKLTYVMRLICFGIIPGGLTRMTYFARTILLGLRRPKSLAVIVTDWVAALSLQSFAERYVEASTSKTQAVLQRVHDKLLSRLARRWQESQIALRLAQCEDRLHIWIDVKQPLDRKAMTIFARTVRRTLRRSREAIVLDCHQLKDTSAAQVEVLLRKLRRYRHQIHLQLTESLYRQLSHDLIPFEYTLVAA